MTVFFVLLMILIIILAFSHFRVDVNKFEIINKKIEDIQIVFSIAFLNRINILKITLDKSKLKKIENNNKVQKLAKRIQEKLIEDYKYIHNFERKSIKEIFEIIKYFKLSNAEINVKIGTESAPLTSFLIMLVSMIITFFIARKVENTKYSVLPVYKDEIYLNLSIKCIISIKMVHIISIIKKLKRKDREKNNGRTFNRRTYANSNG